MKYLKEFYVVSDKTVYKITLIERKYFNSVHARQIARHSDGTVFKFPLSEIRSNFAEITKQGISFYDGEQRCYLEKIPKVSIKQQIGPITGLFLSHDDAIKCWSLSRKGLSDTQSKSFNQISRIHVEQAIGNDHPVFVISNK